MIHHSKPVRLIAIVFLIFSLLTCVLSRALTADITTLNIDEAAFAATTARAIVTHQPLLKESRDNKPPGVYVLYYVAFYFGGLYNMPAVHYLALLWILATAGILYYYGRRWQGVGFGAFGAGFFLLMTSLDSGFLACKTELVMNLPLAAALCLTIDGLVKSSKGRLFLAGVAGGLVVLCKQPAALIDIGLGVGILLFGLFSREIPRSKNWLFFPAAYAIGIATPLILVAILYVYLGSFYEFYLQSVKLPMDLSASDMIPLGRRIFRLFTYSQEYTSYAQFLYFLPLIGIAAPWLTKGSSVLADDRMRRAFRAIVPTAAIFAILAFVSAPDLHLPYLSMTFVPFSVAAALLASIVFDKSIWTASPTPTRVVLAACCILAVSSAAVRALELPLKHVTETGVPPDSPVIAAMKQESASGDRLFVWGWWPELYTETKLPPATRLTITNSVIGLDGEVGKTLDDRADHPYYEHDGWEKLMSDLALEKPKFIVDCKRGIYLNGDHSLLLYPRIRDYVMANYDRVADDPSMRATLYRRKDPG